MIKLMANNSVYIIIIKSNAVTKFAVMIEYWPLIPIVLNYKMEYNKGIAS